MISLETPLRQYGLQFLLEGMYVLRVQHGIMCAINLMEVWFPSRKVLPFAQILFQPVLPILRHRR